MRYEISTHAPLAGRDRFRPLATSDFLISTHAPLAGRDGREKRHHMIDVISTHAPLAGRDCDGWAYDKKVGISTHAPLAGRDFAIKVRKKVIQHFNPRAPCGARRALVPYSQTLQPAFQPTRPLRGATLSAPFSFVINSISTHAPLAGRDQRHCRSISGEEFISTHAPLAGRDTAPPY